MPRAKPLSESKIYRFKGVPVATILGWETRRNWGKGPHKFTMMPRDTSYVPKSAKNIVVTLHTKERKPLHGLYQVSRERLEKGYVHM